MFRNTSIILIGTSLILGSTACSNNETPKPEVSSLSASPTPEIKRVESGFTTYVSPGTEGENKKVFSDKNFLMLSPEEKFTVTSYSTGKQISVDGEKTEPADGEVFHFISYKYKPASGTSFSFDVDGSSIPIADMPNDGVLVVSANEDSVIKILAETKPNGESVIQAINAKTAERITDNREVLYKNNVGIISNGTIKGTGGQSPYLLTVSTVVKSAERSDWIQSKKWSDDGEAFIIVTTNEVEYDMEEDGSPDYNSHVMKLVDDKGNSYIGEKDDSEDAFVFTVPLSMDKFTFHVEVSTVITQTNAPVSSVEGLVTSKAAINF